MHLPSKPQYLRAIRSFVIRAGRMTAGQERALRESWPQYGADFTDAILDLDRLFKRSAPRMLEIGFGVGDALLAYAQNHPEFDCLGIEVHRPGAGHLLLKAEELRLSNIRVCCHDAVEVLERGLAAASIDEAHIFFPDPWHKKRHHKRRLIQPSFVALLGRIVKPGGVVRLATDWRDYAEHMLATFAANSVFRSLGDASGFCARAAHRPLTRFERRGLRLGHGVWDLAYQRINL